MSINHIKYEVKNHEEWDRIRKLKGFFTPNETGGVRGLHMFVAKRGDPTIIIYDKGSHIDHLDLKQADSLDEFISIYVAELLRNQTL